MGHLKKTEQDPLHGNKATQRAAHLSPACLFLPHKTSDPSDTRPRSPNGGFHYK